MDYSKLKQQTMAGARQGYDTVSSMRSANIIKFIKFLLVGGILITVILFAKKIFETTKSFFGLGGNQGDGVNDVNDTWLPWDKQPDKASAGGTFEANKPEPVNSDGTPKITPPKQSVRNLVDEIYKYLGGATFLYYPDVVNKLANLSITDLKQACQYWGIKYRAGEGNKNFYQFISAEDWSGYYQPALGALKKTGYYGN